LYIWIISLKVNQDLYSERDRIRTLDTALSDYKTRQILISILSGGKAVSVSKWLEKAQKAEHTTYPKSRRVKTEESSKGNSAPKDSNLANSDSQGRRKRKDKFRKLYKKPSGSTSAPLRPQ
jgi:hypothetical protein